MTWRTSPRSFSRIRPSCQPAPSKTAPTTRGPNRCVAATLLRIASARSSRAICAGADVVDQRTRELAYSAHLGHQLLRRREKLARSASAARHFDVDILHYPPKG